MKKRMSRNAIRWTICYALLIAAVAVALVLNVRIGSVKIGLTDILRVLLGGRAEDETIYTILVNIRMPRTIAALVLGGALGVSGYLIQTFFRNPIASPYVLGISSGAKLSMSFALVVMAQAGINFTVWGMVAASFVGSMIATALVILCAKRVRSMSMLLVVGIMIGYICTAATDFVLTFAKESDIVGLYGWNRGSFSGTTWDDVAFMSGIVGAACVIALLLSKPVGAYLLGEEYARSIGVRVTATRVAIILLTAILSAAVTAFAGPISFVGIAVPHLTGRMFRSSKPLVIIPASFLFGAVFCTLCDLAARTVFSPTEMAISTVTAIVGAPVVIWMLLSRKRGQSL